MLFHRADVLSPAAKWPRAPRVAKMATRAERRDRGFEASTPTAGQPPQLRALPSLQPPLLHRPH